MSGSVTLDGAVTPVESGSGWLDHEFGGHRPDAAPDVRDDLAWNWLAAQLADGSELTAYALVRCKDGKMLDQRAVIIDQDGRATTHHDVEIKADRSWRSLRTFFDYPTRWQLKVPGAGLEVSIEASFEDQELVTVLSKPAFWEGRCEVRGTLRGAPVSGLAYFERSGVRRTLAIR